MSARDENEFFFGIEELFNNNGGEMSAVQNNGAAGDGEVYTAPTIQRSREVEKKLKDNLSAALSDLQKVGNNDKQYVGLIQTSLKEIASSLEGNLAVTDLTPGEYQTLLYNLADKIGDASILISQAKESSYLMGKVGELLSESSQVLANNVIGVEVEHQRPPHRISCSDVDELRDTISSLDRICETVRNEISQLRGEKDALNVSLAELRGQHTNEKSLQDKYDDLIGVLQGELSCPVCFGIPDPNSRIPSCTNGHITCAACKRGCCPVCRVDIHQVIYNTMAAKLIPHLPDTE